MYVYFGLSLLARPYVTIVSLHRTSAIKAFVVVKTRPLDRLVSNLVIRVNRIGPSGVPVGL